MAQLANGQPVTATFDSQGNLVHKGITEVALAMSDQGLLYAAFAGDALSSGNDFANIDGTPTATWPSTWQTTVDASVPAYGDIWGLESEGGHSWALATNTTGGTILIGGKSLSRGSNCGAGGCASFGVLFRDGSPDGPNHADYHSIIWGGNGWVYAANDGGLFLSMDDGQTWYNQDNNFGVSNSDSVGVNANNIFVNNWDVGACYSTDLGASFVSDPQISGGVDGVQAVADSLGSPYGFVWMSADNNHCNRYKFDGTSWSEFDNGAETNSPCAMAKGQTGGVFTTGSSVDQDNVLESVNYAAWSSASWSPYQSALQATPPWGLVVSNEFTPTVYAFSGGLGVGASLLSVSVDGQNWGAATFTPPWPLLDQFAQTAAGPAADARTNDLYVAGVDPYASLTNPVVFVSPVGQYGTSWTTLTGTQSSGAPGMLHQEEKVISLGVDPDTRAVLVGT